MKHNLKNRPHNPSAQWKYEEWFEAFETNLCDILGAEEMNFETARLANEPILQARSHGRRQLIKEILGDS